MLSLYSTANKPGKTTERKSNKENNVRSPRTPGKLTSGGERVNYNGSICVNIDNLSPRCETSKPMSIESISEGAKDVVDMSSQALINDRIIHENIEVAKALNRSNENGAAMHKFSLWSRPVSSPPCTAVGSLEKRSNSDSSPVCSVAAAIPENRRNSTPLASICEEQVHIEKNTIWNLHSAMSSAFSKSSEDATESSPRTTVCTTAQSTPSSALLETPRTGDFTLDDCAAKRGQAVNAIELDMCAHSMATLMLQSSAGEQEVSEDERADDFSACLRSALDEPVSCSEDRDRLDLCSTESSATEKVTGIVSTPVRHKKSQVLEDVSPFHSKKIHGPKTQWNQTTPVREMFAPATPRSAFGRSASSSALKLPPIPSVLNGVRTPTRAVFTPRTKGLDQQNITRVVSPKIPEKTISHTKMVRNGMKIPPLTAALTLRPDTVSPSAANITATATASSSIGGDISARGGLRNRSAHSRLGSTRRPSYTSPIVKPSPLNIHATKLFASNDDSDEYGDSTRNPESCPSELERVFRHKSESPLPKLAARASKLHFDELNPGEDGKPTSMSRIGNYSASTLGASSQIGLSIHLSRDTDAVTGSAENISKKHLLSDSAKRLGGSDEECTIRWKRGQLIGEGTFGKVYKGLNEQTGELLAVKQLYLADTSESDVDGIQEEINVICNLEHANIVNYLGTTITDRHLFILLEYVPGGSISDMLTQFGPFSEDLIRRFSHQILLGLEYLHGKLIVHRDIKGSNILVTDGGVAKLSDFGCSKQLAGLQTMSIEGSAKVLKGSVPWMAPEVIKQCGYGRSSDIWSFGATVIEMGKYVVDNNSLLSGIFNHVSMTHVFIFHSQQLDSNRGQNFQTILRHCFILPRVRKLRLFRTPCLPCRLNLSVDAWQSTPSHERQRRNYYWMNFSFQNPRALFDEHIRISLHVAINYNINDIFLRLVG